MPDPHDPTSSTPPEAWAPLVRLRRFARRPVARFLQVEAASGVLLLVAATVALVWANSPWAASYARFWHAPVGIRLGHRAFERPIEWFVNDALMAVFFFVVGLEIRREIDHGELSAWRRAALPAAAALGGMVAPALIYLALAGAPSARAGWGVPMATDIAFAVGALALLGRRVPPALRVLLLALAVLDDLGAIVVIAVAYSSGVSAAGLLVAALGLGGILALRLFGVRAKALYVAPALVVWAGTYAAGVHPTIAGVVVGLVTPVRAWLGTSGFVRGVRVELTRLSAADDGELSTHEVALTLRRVDVIRREAVSPAEGLIERLHPWVAFVIMPLFALANAGVAIRGPSLDRASTTIAAGVAIGLLVGKPVGVLAASALALRLRVAALPRGLGARHLLVLGVVAGVGFTMSLLVAQLAFADPVKLNAARLGVLAASGVAALLALALGRALLAVRAPDGAARSVEEAEASTEL